MDPFEDMEPSEIALAQMILGNNIYGEWYQFLLPYYKNSSQRKSQSQSQNQIQNQNQNQNKLTKPLESNNNKWLKIT